MLNNEDVAKKSPLVKVLIISVCLLLAAVVALGVVLGVVVSVKQVALADGESSGDDPSKSEWEITHPFESTGNYEGVLGNHPVGGVADYSPVNETFDRYICCQLGATPEEVLGSWLISEKDKDIVAHCRDHFKEYQPDWRIGCSLFLGEVGGEDAVLLLWNVGLPLDCEICKKSYLFKSNLFYKLNDVVNAFEEQIGEKLPDEWFHFDFNRTVGEYEGIFLQINGNRFPSVGEGYFSKEDKYQSPYAGYTEEEMMTIVAGGPSKESNYYCYNEYFYVYHDNTIRMVTRGFMRTGRVKCDMASITENWTDEDWEEWVKKQKGE